MELRVTPAVLPVGLLVLQETMFGKGNPLFSESTCNLNTDVAFWLFSQRGYEGAQTLSPVE